MNNILKTILLLPSLHSLDTDAMIFSHVEKIERPGNNVYVHGSVDFWEDDDKTANPCYGLEGCTFAINIPYADNGDAWASYGQQPMDAKNFKTIGEAGKKFKETHSLPFKVFINSFKSRLPSFSTCVAIYYSYNGQSDWAKIIPSNRCIGVPPEELNCSITGNTNFSYGTIQTTEVNGRKIIQELNIKCNMDASLSIFVIGQGSDNIRLNSNGTLAAKMKINGVSGVEGDNVEVKADISSPLKITSELIQKGEIDEGYFHGSGVIAIGYN